MLLEPYAIYIVSRWLERWPSFVKACHTSHEKQYSQIQLAKNFKPFFREGLINPTQISTKQNTNEAEMTSVFIPGHTEEKQ